MPVVMAIVPCMESATWSSGRAARSPWARMRNTPRSTSIELPEGSVRRAVLISEALSEAWSRAYLALLLTTFLTTYSPVAPSTVNFRLAPVPVSEAAAKSAAIAARRMRSELIPPVALITKFLFPPSVTVTPVKPVNFLRAVLILDAVASAGSTAETVPSVRTKHSPVSPTCIVRLTPRVGVFRALGAKISSESSMASNPPVALRWNTGGATDTFSPSIPGSHSRADSISAALSLAWRSA